MDDGMRLYFDLRNHQYTLPDVYGVEVSDVHEARRAALEMIRALRDEDPAVAQNWSGWKVSVVDAAGTVAFAIDLDSVP
jgi:hypothetical protein